MINDIFGKSRGKLGEDIQIAFIALTCALLNITEKSSCTGNHMKADVLPIREDLSDFTDAILRIQTVYNLSASEVPEARLGTFFMPSSIFNAFPL